MSAKSPDLIHTGRKELQDIIIGGTQRTLLGFMEYSDDLGSRNGKILYLTNLVSESEKRTRTSHVQEFSKIYLEDDIRNVSLKDDKFMFSYDRRGIGSLPYDLAAEVFF